MPTSIAGFSPHPGSEMRADEEKKIEKYFLARSTAGVVPSVASLETYCRSKGIRATRPFLRGLRYKFKFTAIFSHKRKPKHFMGMSIQRYGMLMIDRAYYDYKRDDDEIADLKLSKSKRRKRIRTDRSRYKGTTLIGMLCQPPV
jgi:hypothetical protein